MKSYSLIPQTNQSLETLTAWWLGRAALVLSSRRKHCLWNTSTFSMRHTSPDSGILTELDFTRERFCFFSFEVTSLPPFFTKNMCAKGMEYLAMSTGYHWTHQKHPSVELDWEKISGSIGRGGRTDSSGQEEGDSGILPSETLDSFPMVCTYMNTFAQRTHLYVNCTQVDENRTSPNDALVQVVIECLQQCMLLIQRSGGRGSGGGFPLLKAGQSSIMRPSLGKGKK